MMTTGGPRVGGPGTLNQLFFDAVERFNKPNALQVKRNGRYEPISHSMLLERVRRVALGLQELGVRGGDRVAILSENRPEWAIADFACFPWIVTHKRQDISLDEFPNVKRWFTELRERPAFQKGVDLGKELASPSLDARAREVLFGQKAEGKP